MRNRIIIKNPVLRNVHLAVAAVLCIAAGSCKQEGSVSDADGNSYHTVVMGGQEWLAENLKTTTYADGTPIPQVTNSADWRELSTPSFSWYDNDRANRDRYGALYNWYVVESGRLCPAGWRVPSQGDWAELVDYVSDNNTRLKSCRQMESPEGRGCATAAHPRWHSHGSIFGSDDYGFSALPGGFRSVNGFFTHVGYFGGWWTSSEDNSQYAWYKGMPFNYSYIYSFNSGKEMGLSVRCMRDHGEP